MVLIAIALVGLSLFGAQAFIASGLERTLNQHVTDELVTQSSLIATALASASAWQTPQADPLVRTLAAQAHARVTLIDPEGRVVADSAVPVARLGRLENHGQRPEVRAARAGRTAVSSRESDTLRRPQRYAATAVTGPNGRWVLRVAVSPSLNEETHAATQRLLGLGGLLGLVMAAAAAWMAFTVAARPLQTLTNAARAMTRDLSVRTRVRQDDEVGALATALDALADNLAASMQSLEKERDRLGAILEAMTEGVLVTDRSGNVVLANRALREMFFVGAEALGRPPIEALRSAELHEMLAALSRSGSPESREFPIGTIRPRRVVARVAPIDDPGSGAVAVFFDVTELRRLETVRRDFVANVSHELRTPVAAIRASSETLLLGALQKPEMAGEFVEIIDRHAERLHRLVEDLLELSKIEAKELQLTLEPIALGPEVDRAMALLSVSAAARQTALKNTLTAALPPVVADRRALEHVLSNLLDNAIKYTPNGSAVTVSAAVQGAYLRLGVADNGPGVEARHLPRLFERFYRVDPGRARHQGGTGLGLAIVKHLAEAMGATVSVESAVGVGSTFYVTLALATPPPA